MNKFEKFLEAVDPTEAERLRALFAKASEETDPDERRMKVESIVTEIRRLVSKGPAMAN